MSIAIDPALRPYVEECLRSGKYADESQVVNAALAQMLERERLLAAIDEGLADFKRGDIVSYEFGDRDKFIDDIRRLSEQMEQQESES